MTLGHPAVGAGATVIAVLLTDRSGANAERAGLYARARAIALAVCEAGPLDALRDIVDHARRDAVSSELPDIVRDEARAFLESLERGEVAEALLGSLEALGSLTAEGDALIDACGSSALWSIARRLRAQPNGALAPELRRALLARGVSWWVRGLAHAELRPLVELTPLFPLMRALDPERAWPVASALLRHPDPDARRQVGAFLLGLGRPEASWRRLVTVFLQDADRSLADMARAALLRFPEQARDLVPAALDPRVPCPAEGRLRADLESLIATTHAGPHASATEDEAP